jgi:hypothetical protein
MAPRPPGGILKTSFPWYLYEYFTDINVGLNLATPINPGQTIDFHWTSWPLKLKNIDLGIITFSLHLVDAFGNVDPQAVLREDTLSAADSQKVVQGSFTSHQIAARPPQDLEKRIYTAGPHTLRLVLKGTGKDGPYESEDELLQVVLPTVDATWWNWTVPANRVVAWKKDKYLVAGNLNNRSSQPVTFSATLLEKNTSPQPVDPPGEKALATVAGSSALAGNASTPVTYGQVDLSKSWSWFIFGVFTLIAPTDQVYQYRVRVDMTDPYQNAFPPFFTTPSINVGVSVDRVKFGAYGAAVSFTVTAAALLIAAAAALAIPVAGEFAAAVLAGIASGFEAAALIAGGIAQDPPVEDRLYRLLYEPAAVQLPDADEEMQPLVRFAQAVFAVIAHVEALGHTDSRIASARAAHARKALETQTNHFEKLRKELPHLARQVRDALPEAAALFSERSPTPAKADEAVRTLNHDLPFRAQLLKAWQDAGGSSKDLDTLTQLTAMPEFGQFIVDPETTLAVAGRSTERLAAVAAETQPSG